MNNKILGILLAMVIVCSSVSVLAITDEEQMWMDLIGTINARWAKAMNIAVQEAYQEGRNSKICSSSNSVPIQELVEVVTYARNDLNKDGVFDILDLDIYASG